jgi:UDP-glucose 4-epimerase
MGSTALVVGCNGFLGRHLSARLVRDGWRVWGLSREGDVRVPPGVRALAALPTEAVPGGSFEVVFALAARWPSSPAAEFDKRLDREMVATNVRLVDRLQLCFPDSRLVLASSVAVYGAAPGVRTERLVTVAPSRYGQTKLAAELLVGGHASFAVLRFSSLCGPGMARTTFVPRVLDQARGGEGIITLFGDGSRRQDYLAVDDAVSLLVRAGVAQRNGYFLGARGISVENRAIAAHVAERVVGARLEFAGEDSSPSFDYDPRETWDALGFAPQQTVFDAVDALWKNDRAG